MFIMVNYLFLVLMMIFAGHVGMALIAAFLFKLDPLLMVIGGVLPDFDVFLSFIGFKWGSVHRKFTHSLLFPALLFVFSFWFPVLIPVSVGVLVHFIGDLDHWGLPLFYPFSGKFYSLIKVNHHSHNFKSALEGVINWFSNRGSMFWFEWSLFIIGFFLTIDYWINLISFLLNLVY